MAIDGLADKAGEEHGGGLGGGVPLTGCATIFPFGSPCQNKFAPGGQDSLAVRINTAGPKIGSAITAVRVMAPNAKVYVVGYPALLPETGSCFPQMPYTASDVRYLRDTNKRLNAMLAGQALLHGAIFVDTYPRSTDRLWLTAVAGLGWCHGGDGGGRGVAGGVGVLGGVTKQAF